MNEESQTNQTAILKELSDIKSSLAVNTNETANIKGSVNEIKQTVNQIKNDYVSRREMTEAVQVQKAALDVIKDKVNLINRILYGVVATILIALLNAVAKILMNR